MAVNKKSAKIKRAPEPEAAPTKRQVKEARKEKLSKTAKIVLGHRHPRHAPVCDRHGVLRRA